MSDKPARLEYGTSNAASPEDNILRGLFTFFLNTGAFDDRMAAAKLAPESARTDHVGTAFIKAHPEVKNEFLAWAASDDLADYLLSSKSVLEAFRDRFRNKGYMSPFDAIVGTRFKQITGFDRKRMPKDLKKSFYTKASNRLTKFAAEWGTAKFRVNAQVIQDSFQQFQSGHFPDVEEWLRFALSKKGQKSWIQSDSLREIRNLYVRYMKLEPVDDVVKELLKQAVVVGVMQA
jgi:hypothetical protein